LSKKIFCFIITIISISSVAIEISQAHYLNETPALSDWMGNDLLAVEGEKYNTTISQNTGDDSNSRTYCPSAYSNQTDDWITNVTIGSINNTSGQNGSNSYGDYTHLSTDLSTEILLYGLSVSFSSGTWTQHVWAWIDWNRDDVFDETTESYDLGDGESESLLLWLNVPAGAHMGPTRLRIIEQYASDPGPCDPHGTTYGETEDYTVNVVSSANSWVGAVDNNWHNPANWYYYFVPDATTDVLIPNVTNKCWVYATNAECNNLTIVHGTSHDFRIFDEQMHVNGDMEIHGMLTMDHPMGNLVVDGSIFWEAGSSAYMSGYSGIWIEGDWIFRSGSNVHLDDGLVAFQGSGGSYLRCFSDDCYFNDLYAFKNSGGWLSNSINSTHDLNVHGDLYIQPDAIGYVYSPEYLNLQGNLYNAGYLYCYGGTFAFIGDTQSIDENPSYTTTTQFNYLKLNSTTSTTILNKDITVTGGVKIESGQFIPNDHTISVGWYWINNVGPTGFVEGNSRVRFYDSWSSEVLSNEDFNIIEVDKPGSSYLNIDGPTVTCQHYDWTQGGISVRLNGEFTAYDLIDDGIYGILGVDNTGGTINLYNYDDYVDLNGHISLTGGTMNVYGGTTPSYWPFAADATISIVDGVLDFHDQGIWIYDSPTYTLTENISGGTIRTAGVFWGECADFSPDYGTFEFYGSDDVSLHTINSCYLNNVVINKTSREVSNTNIRSISGSTALIDERSGLRLSNGTRSNEVILSGLLHMAGSMTINNGILNSNGYDIDVLGNWTNNVGDSGFIEGNGRVKFYGYSSSIFTNENFNILEVDMTDYFYGLDIEGVTVYCQQYDWNKGYISISDNGTFTADDLLDNGIYGGWNIEDTGGTINISNYGDYVDLNGSISLTSGTMNVYGGTTYSYWPYTSHAIISIVDGVLDFHDQGIWIYDSATYILTENITGGTIRTAGGFWGESSDFSPEHGTLEFYSSMDGDIYTINGCNLHNVVVNKPSAPARETNREVELGSNSIIDERSGRLISDGTRSNELTMTDNLYIEGSLVIDNGILNSNGYNILIEGDWTNLVGDAGFVESTGWVISNGSIILATLHTSETFNNLMLSNANSGYYGLTFSDEIIVNVNGDLDLQYSTLEMNYGSQLHVGGDVFIRQYDAGLNADDGANLLSVGGNWTNENPANTEYYGYWKGGEIVTFNGSGDQIIDTDAPVETFGNLVINKSGGYFRPNDNLKIDGGLHIQSGDWWDNTSGLNHTFVGNVLIEAGGGYYPLGTTTFTGIGDQYYQNNGGLAIFGELVIDKSGTLYLNSIMVVHSNHTTTVEEGVLNLNGNIFKSDGDININDGGEIVVDAGAYLSIVTSLDVNSGGQFTASGESGNNAHIWKDVLGYYAFEVNSGGSISANYADFDDIDAYGIWVKDGAFVDPDNCFNNCNFINQDNIPPNSRLFINSDQVLNINNINFLNNPYIPNTYNVGKSIPQGELIITTTGGDFTGPLYEYDPLNRIFWTDYPHGRWTGNVSADWFDPLNWSDFIVPGTASDVIIPAGTPNDPVVNDAIGECHNITVETGASLEIGNNELHVGNIFDNYGELIITNSLAKLYVSIIYWMSGSTGNITAGEIHGSVWTWGDANVSLGTGNTVFLNWSLNQYGTLGSFGNLTLYSGDYVDGSDPIHVSGNFTAASGSNWDIKTNMIIDGDWTIENSASLDVIDGAHVTCNSILTLDNELFIFNNSLVTVHGMLNFNSSGFMVIENSTFNCDYALPSGWINILGGIDMVSGSLEFPDANISFIGGQYISGGTIVAGRTVHADLPGVFQPTGGKLELVGSGLGHYLQIRNGNYLNKLWINRSTPIGVHPDSPLVIQDSVRINSELMLQGNTITMYGDLNINAGGILNIDENAELIMADSKWIYVNNGGIFKTLGSAGNEALITHTSGYYSFWVENGGTIAAEYTIFEYMSGEGVYVRPGSFIDPIHSFHNCLFQNGESGGWLLTIYNDQDFVVNNAIFPTNTWSGSYNVFKNTTPGDITFINATGGFEGEDHEFDPYSHVHWYTGLPKIDDLTIQYNAGSNEIELNWTYPIPVDQFKIYRSTDPYDFTGAVIFTTPTAGYSEPATGIYYFYRVTAENTSN